MTTMTKVAKFTAIANALEENGITLEGFDAQEFLATQIAQTQKKNASKAKGMTKTQKENVGIKADVLKALTGKGKVKATDIVGKVAGVASTQKASAMLNALAKTGEVVKTQEKGVSYFALAETDEVED